jgi:hypothetical protein
MKKSNVIRSHQDQDFFGEIYHLGQGGVTGGFKNPQKWTTDSHPFKLVRREPTVTQGEFVFIEEESKMSTLKKRFKQKLEQAKRIREKVGDPVALGRSIVEIPEDKANEVLSEHKGYKYVSKKS